MLQWLSIVVSRGGFCASNSYGCTQTFQTATFLLLHAVSWDLNLKSPYHSSHANSCGAATAEKKNPAGFCDAEFNVEGLKVEKAWRVTCDDVEFFFWHREEGRPREKQYD